MSIFKKFDRLEAIEAAKNLEHKEVVEALKRFNLPALVRFLNQVDNLYWGYWAQGKQPPMLSIAGMWDELMNLFDIAATVPGSEVKSLELTQLDEAEEADQAGAVDKD